MSEIETESTLKEETRKSEALLMEELDQSIEGYEQNTVHPHDILETLLELRDINESSFKLFLKKVSNEFLADIISEMPSHIQEEVSEYLGRKKLAKVASEMDTDDAADFIQIISESDEKKAEDVLEKISIEDREGIRNLISYEDDVAGAFMQLELFKADINETIIDSIQNLRELISSGEAENIHQVFLVEEDGKFIGSLSLEALLLLDHRMSYKSVLGAIEKKIGHTSVHHREKIRDVVEKVSNYNLSVVPVLDDEGKLLGRITSDDIYDIIETQATEDIFHLAGVDAELEQTEKIIDVAKSRGLWLGLNLLTAIAASVVISYFEGTIQSLVALAVLMPIIASMGGNAGTQTLTVTVRQLAIGEIDWDDAFFTIQKEIYLSLINGLIFAIVIGGLAYLWYQMPMLGVVIALSTVINLFVAGLFGSIIPLFLAKFNIDPALGSTVLLTTVTDIIGFLSFLGLAKLIIL